MLSATQISFDYKRMVNITDETEPGSVESEPRFRKMSAMARGFWPVSPSTYGQHKTPGV